MLNQTEIDFFKAALQERKETIKKNLLINSNERDGMRENELKDEADHASMSLDSAVDNAISIQQSKELAEIELALDKIKDKTYGTCDLCGSEINIERLKVKNFARYCINCREVVEKE